MSKGAVTLSKPFEYRGEKYTIKVTPSKNNCEIRAENNNGKNSVTTWVKKVDMVDEIPKVEARLKRKIDSYLLTIPECLQTLRELGFS